MTVKKSTKTVEKSIYFTLLLYPENLPSDWKIQLETTGRPIAISPLHNKDVMSTETVKKELKRIDDYIFDNSLNISPETMDKFNKRKTELNLNLNGKKLLFLKEHYHVIYVAKNPVTADSVRKKLQKLLGFECVAQVKIIATSVRNMYDYLTHESIDAIAKKKHIYPKDEIVLLNNFDIDRYDELDAADKKDLLNTIIDVIKTNTIKNIIDLEFFFDEHGKEYNITTKQMRDVIDGKAGILRLYFDGAYQRDKYEREQKERKEQSDLMNLNDELVESNFKYKQQIEDMKFQINSLKKEIPEVVNYVDFEEFGVEK